MSHIVVVTGGRDYIDGGHIWCVLDGLDKKFAISLLVHGACPVNGRNNADHIAEDWAKDREIPYLGMPARFKQVGPKAGPQRNETMVRMYGGNARLVAFPGGRGTNGTVKIAERLNAEERYGITIIDERSAVRKRS